MSTFVVTVSDTHGNVERFRYTADDTIHALEQYVNDPLDNVDRSRFITVTVRKDS